MHVKDKNKEQIYLCQHFGIKSIIEILEQKIVNNNALINL